MKKIYIVYLCLTFLGSFAQTILSEQTVDRQKLLSMVVSFHNSAFGVDHLFDQPIEEKKLAAWLEVSDAVADYVDENNTDLFGTKDKTLINSLVTIEKANQLMVNAIRITYGVRISTKSLIRMAALFQTIENKMSVVINTLKNTAFILNRKKNAQNILLALARIIRATAKKANKDTRMGHRTDIKDPRLYYNNN
jgi:hypothetical protein